MRYIILILFIGFTFISCQNELDFKNSSGTLSFSKETVYLDTVFSNIGSSTYTLKVYNNSKENISIPSVRLAKGAGSNYRLMVDGMSGNEFTNVELLAKDSLYVFIEITSNVAQANPTDFLYTDQIEFGVGAQTQIVELVTLIQDAVFLYPEKFANGTTETLPINGEDVFGFYLDDNDPINGDELHFTNTKPYVIYGYAAVPPGKTLLIDAGSRVHFHANSGLIVANTASLNVQGTPSLTAALENEVIFEGDRLEPGFSETPGQWGTVLLTSGSLANNISNLTIKNASIGLYVNGNDGSNAVTTSLHNVQIYNCSNYGLLATTGFVEGKNVVINNCGESSFAALYGGSYEFTHCTFANYWQKPNQTSVLISNEDIGLGNQTDLIKADFKNCIIYGATNIGLLFDKKSAVFEYQFNYCLIKFVDFNNQFTGNTLYQFATNSRFTNCIIATNSTVNAPDFKNPNQNKFEIGQNSAAKATADFSFSAFNDLKNDIRTNPSDIGAYNVTTF